MDKSSSVSGAYQSGTVINMQRFRSGNSLTPIRQAEAYWTALRIGDSIPRRADIDPAGLENLLQYAFVLERIAPGLARFRLAGQHLTRLAGLEVRGIPFTALFTPASRNTASATIETTFDGPAISELTLSSPAQFGCRAIEAHMILLPLKSDEGEVTRALGVLVSDRESGDAPVRFNIAGSAIRAVTGLHYGQTTPHEIQPEPQHPSAGFAEPQARFNPKHPHLRLVKSDDTP